MAHFPDNKNHAMNPPELRRTESVQAQFPHWTLWTPPTELLGLLRLLCLSISEPIPQLSAAIQCASTSYASRFCSQQNPRGIFTIFYTFNLGNCIRVSLNPTTWVGTKSTGLCTPTNI